MENEYLNNLKSDMGLYEAIKDQLADLEKLSPVQVEKLVFYLKSLHSYHPKSANESHLFSEFNEKLAVIKNSSDQLEYQKQTRSNILKGIGGCVFAGFLIAVAIIVMWSSQILIATILFAFVIGILLYSDGKYFLNAVQMSKHQEQDYLLNSIRTAKACNELDWAGLFSYNKVAKLGPQSDEDIERIGKEVGELSKRLREALYNDEYFQYSSSELRSPSGD